MPAGAKMSIASMKAEPMMPNMSVTPLATRVSTKASDGVIFCTPVTAARTGVAGGCLVMEEVSWGRGCWARFLESWNQWFRNSYRRNIGPHRAGVKRNSKNRDDLSYFL